MDILDYKEFNSNKEVLKQAVPVDDSIIEHVVLTIMSLGINRFNELTVKQKEEWGYVLLLVDDKSHKYIITLDDNGYLGTVRKDNLQGEIIHLIRDD